VYRPGLDVVRPLSRGFPDPVAPLVDPGLPLTRPPSTLRLTGFAMAVEVT
jgi:hypothetical protein